MAELILRRSGRVWKFGDQINTDLILPMSAMRLPGSAMHSLAFEAIRPGWVKAVRPGDLIVAGANFGLGSSRPIGLVLKACGIAGVVAESINGLGFRNCLNAGLPAMAAPQISAAFEDGDEAEIDFMSGRITNLSRGTLMHGAPLALPLAEIVAAGGVIPMLVAGGYIASKAYSARAI